ncbi:MAG: PKD domain-containing protein, partial [Bacteroidia bacterium]|nr:PKD domain-containing protein [Bacteroidia bacterium]
MTGHKNIYLFFYFVLGVVTLNAQTIHFSEDFEGASGTTPPAGWTIEVVSGDTTIDNWHFDNPMNREIGKTNSEGQFAIFDDAFVADTIADTIDLVSPAIDLQGKNKSKLYFYEYFEGGFGGVGQVYYRSSSGDAWVKIYEVTQTSSSNPDKISINLQGLGTSPTSQIKFRWIGKEAFWWIIDDVFIYDNPSKDAGAVFVTDLPSGCVVTLSTPFGITARNFGTGNLGEIVFNYQLNNDTIVSDTVKFGTVLQSDSLYTHVFDSTSQPQFVEGFNQLKMWTSNPGGTADVFPINDTINATTTLSKLQVANFPFYEDFEDSVFVVSMCGNLGASGNGRIEIVSTDVFPSCEGGNMVVMDANKSASTIDKLDLLVDLSSCVNKSLTFTYGHVSDEKDPEDALYISVDNGGSFVKIYDYEFDSIPDSSCYTVTLNLDSIADTMGFGLTATSLLRWQHAGNDSIGSADDGFYIDDIQIDLAGQQIVDAGMKNIILPDNEIYIDSSFEVTITIRNFPASNDTLVALNINFQLDSGTVITEFWAGCLAPGDEIGYTFTNELITDSVEGIFTFCVWTSVPNSLYMYELDYSNDTICMDIDVRCSPMKADFGWGNNCLGDSIQFNATAPAAISWLWDFNNGDSSSAENPIYFYGDTGVYYVTLFTYDSKGCMDSINQWVEIFEKPWANFDADTVCQGSETSFMDNSLDAIIWDWDFKDGNNSALSDPVNTYTTAGVYDVKLVVESIEGCKDDTTISVLVYDLPIANAGADTFLTSCTATLDLLASASGGLSPYQYY